MDIRFIHTDRAEKSVSSSALTLFCSKAKSFGLLPSIATSHRDALEIAAEAERFAGEVGQKITLLAPAAHKAARITVIGTGGESSAQNDLLSGGAAMTAALGGNHDTAVFVINDDQDPVAVAEGAALRAYRFDKYRTKEPVHKKPVLKTVLIACNNPIAAGDAFALRREVVHGVDLARDLVSEPSNILYPESYAERIKELEAYGIEVEVLGEERMAALGMHSLLGVGQGSVRESQMVIMRYNGAGDDSQPIAFVGKGVTFDTGGISIKPAEGMEAMKWDMGGSAIVVGTMRALAGRKAKVNAVGIVGLVENMPDGNAQRPGDIVSSMSGQTIEVLNTDAEGRLVLADCLWYCKETFKPKWMVDLATLTGAIIVSLGNEYAGYFTDDAGLAEGIFNAGDQTGEKTWRMPLHANYDKLINTPVADMKNIGGRGAGSITAAQFLKRFTGDTPWAHIDVAGVVWSDKDSSLWEKGATGYGVRMLDNLVATTEEGA